MKRLLVATLLVVTSMAAWPQETAAAPGAGETLTFRMDHSGTTLASYTFTINEDGSAVYAASYPPDPPKFSPYAATAATAPNAQVSTTIQLTPGTTERLFEHVRATNGFHDGCASKAKHIANTGQKTLVYSSGGKEATCSWNYSEDKNVVFVADTFEAIALTLDEGRKLDQKHRYDRLALDPEIEFLFDSAKQGKAQELATIAPALRAIADDPQVLERVRTRAAKLLAQGGATQ